MNEPIRIVVEKKGDPQLRKLARALLSLVQRQATETDGSTTTGGDISQGASE